MSADVDRDIRFLLKGFTFEIVQKRNRFSHFSEILNKFWLKNSDFTFSKKFLEKFRNHMATLLVNKILQL